MTFAVSLSVPFMAALLVTVAAWIWALSRPVERGGYFPDISPLFDAGAALIITLAAWLGYFAFRVFFQ